MASYGDEHLNCLLLGSDTLYCGWWILTFRVYLLPVVYARGRQTTARDFILSGPPTVYQTFVSIVYFL